MPDNIKQEKKNSTWLRPWNLEKFDDLYNRDERYFAILTKGTLAWLTQNIVLYNKPINHFIYTTGSSYLYVENNGYTFSMTETSGEDYIYMKMPRCVMEMGDINVPTEELSSPYARGQYERRDGNEIKGFNAQMRRLPIELSFSAKYVLSNFNESIILLQELIDKVSFQQYFNIVYLGQVIQCSIEIDSNFQIQVNRVDMTSTDTNQKTIELQYKICSNYPRIDERTEIENKFVIETYQTNLNIFDNNVDNVIDVNDKTLDSGNLINLNDNHNDVQPTSITTTTTGDTGNILRYKNDTLEKIKFDKNNM